MKKSRVKRFTHRHAPKAGGEFCVIQDRFRSGSGRTWFTTEAEAFEEASAILTGDKVCSDYVVPERLVVVRAVGAVQAKIVTRRVSPGVLSGEEDDNYDDGNGFG